MNLLFEPGQQPIDFVLHPTDLSEASEPAFHHALAFALLGGAQFTLLHAVGRRATDNWVEFPSVRATLASWRAAGGRGPSPRHGSASVSKIEVDLRDPVAASLQYIDRNSVDLIVMATTGRHGLARLVRAPRAELLARRSRLMTLFVPDGARPFVSPTSGAVTLKRILLPVDPATDPRPAMQRAVATAALLEDPDVEIILLHVGSDTPSFGGDVSSLPYCRWAAEHRRGDAVPGIIKAAEELEADVLFMPTSWSRPGFGRSEGGVTEGVLATAPCPVMTVPVDA